MLRFLFAAVFALLAACVQIPPSPQDVQAKKFEAVPSKSVIYIVRTPMDSNEVSGLVLNDSGQITTYRGTFYRWEVAPGPHRIAGYAQANESITLTTEAGKIYFLEHTVRGTQRSGPQTTSLRQVDPQYGRALVARSQHL